MKVTMLIGEPAVGKSTIMKKFMSRVGNWMFESPKWVPHHVHLKNGEVVFVLGRYDDKTHEFPGTDRMSMACQKHVIQFLIAALNDGVKAVFFEGDRLGNDSMIKALQYMVDDLAVLHIATNQDRKRDSQSDTFRMSRRTKIRNMTGPGGRCARTNQSIQMFVNDTPDDAAFIVDYLMEHRL